jgi:hypothetical protein
VYGKRTKGRKDKGAKGKMQQVTGCTQQVGMPQKGKPQEGMLPLVKYVHNFPDLLRRSKNIALSLFFYNL